MVIRVILAILVFLVVVATPTPVAAQFDQTLSMTGAESALMTLPALVFVTLRRIHPRRGA